MAVANARKDENATAGIIYGWLCHRKTGNKYGGLVCEYNGNKSVKEAKIQLNESLNELYENGYSRDYSLEKTRYIVENIIPKKKYGTSLVELCFVNYIYPIIDGH
jgi:arginine decarboxylase